MGVVSSNLTSPTMKSRKEKNKRLYQLERELKELLKEPEAIKKFLEYSDLLCELTEDATNDLR